MDKNTVRNSLGDLIESLPDQVPGLEKPCTIEKQSNIVGIAPYSKAEAQAKRVMSKLLKFYLSENVIEENEYIKAKNEIETYSLTMLIRQMQNSEAAIEMLMGSISSSDVVPRMFEVLSDLQRTLLDIIKNQTMYMMAVEESAKKLSRDIDVYKPTNSLSQGHQSSTGIKTRGSKDLIKSIHEINKLDLDEADTIENEE